MRSKLKIIIPIIVAVIAIIIAALTINFTSNQMSDIDSLIKDGYYYLNDVGDFDEAIAIFNKIISLDPMNVDAYIGLARAYQGKGDIDKAIETLKTGYEKTGDQRLKDMLDELSPPEETTITTTTPTTVTTTETTTTATAPENEIVEIDNGGYYEMAFNTNGDIIHEDFYDENGNNWGSADVEYYPNGNKRSETYYREDGTYYVKEYDENGKFLKRTNYNSDGSIYYYEINEYDQNGNMTMNASYYGDDNSLRMYLKFEYNEDDYKIYMEQYDSLRYRKEVYTEQSQWKDNTYSWTIKYNDNYTIEYTYASEGTDSYLDGDKNIKTSYSYSSSGDYFHDIREYDENEKCISCKEYSSFNGESESYSGHSDYKYDSQGREIEAITYSSYNGEENITFRITHTYDGLGNTLIMTGYYGDGTIMWQEKY